MQDEHGGASDVGRLQAEANDLARRMAKVQDPAASYQGIDTHAVVTVTLDGNGLIRDVAVAQGWQRVGGAAQLAVAVQEAREAAVLERLRRLDEILKEQLDSDEVPPAGSATSPSGADVSDSSITELVESLSAQASSASTVAALRELVSMLEGVDADLDELARQVSGQQSRPYEGRSTGGHVTVRVAGDGAVLRVDYESRWLRGAHEFNIGRETRDAFEAAYRVAGAQTMQGLLPNSRIAALDRLAGDPLELARRLGLHRQ